jgi:glycosyltransferase involved in cell wall biosynthesis
MARVFVGIPTLDRPEYVMQTVASLRAQRFTDWRAIVSDNGSDPETRDHIERAIMALGDPRIGFHRQPVNLGEYGQGRFFFALADDSELFMILHDDDVLLPDMLTRGVTALEIAPDTALYVADPCLIDRHGLRSAARTQVYRHDHGRDVRGPGRFRVLDTHLATGFTPISGTLFRTAALAEAGLVDADCHGNFPFECNVMLRLGDIGATGWFDPTPLIEVRYHAASLRNTLKLMDNPQVVRTMLTLFERRHYSGVNERRRLTLVSRLHRADAVIRLREGDGKGSRAALANACRANPRSVKAWMLLPLVSIAATRLTASSGFMM